jgi:hypothetical protein
LQRTVATCTAMQCGLSADSTRTGRTSMTPSRRAGGSGRDRTTASPGAVEPRCGWSAIKLLMGAAERQARQSERPDRQRTGGQASAPAVNRPECDADGNKEVDGRHALEPGPGRRPVSRAIASPSTSSPEASAHEEFGEPAVAGGNDTRPIHTLSVEGPTGRGGGPCVCCLG